MALTRKQLDALRETKPGPSGNRLANAIEILDIPMARVADGTGLRYTYVSDVTQGRWQTITVENAHKFAVFFGCHIEDLFPSREAVAS